MEKTDVVKKVAENIRNLMNEASLSNSELGRRAKIPPGTISKIASGQVGITIPMAMKLAQGLNVPITDILTGLYDKNKILPKESTKNKAESLSIGVLSINDRRVTCLKDHSGKMIGESNLPGGLDLTQKPQILVSLIQESIIQALPSEKISNTISKNSKLSIVTQSYEFSDARNKFILIAKKTFRDVLVLPDWQITYLTAFTNGEGISLVVDMGVSVSYMHNKTLRKLGGWKFPVYDLGGENWLGVELIRHTIDCAEGYCKQTELANKVLSHYNGKIERITEECFTGQDPDAYSRFAKILIESYFRGDKTAKDIIQRGFDLINRSILKIDETVGKPLKITINGSLSDVYKPFFQKERLTKSSTSLEKASILTDLSAEELHKKGIEY